MADRTFHGLTLSEEMWGAFGACHHDILGADLGRAAVELARGPRGDGGGVHHV